MKSEGLINNASTDTTCRATHQTMMKVLAVLVNLAVLP